MLKKYIISSNKINILDKDMEGKLKGIDLYIDCNLQINRGFNCSTAFVICCSLLSLKANDLLSQVT